MKTIPHYINKKGEIVFLEVTAHAWNRFLQRWKLVYPEQPLPNDTTIAELFSRTNRVKNFSPKELERLKRYGKDSMFFRTNSFTFVVQNATIVTVEICAKDSRYLNRV